MFPKGSFPVPEPLSFNSLNQSTLPSYSSPEEKKKTNYICMLQELMLAVGPTGKSLLADDQPGMEKSCKGKAALTSSFPWREHASLNMESPQMCSILHTQATFPLIHKKHGICCSHKSRENE